MSGNSSLITMDGVNAKNAGAIFLSIAAIFGEVWDDFSQHKTIMT
jgi:hypothetical protein